MLGSGFTVSLATVPVHRLVLCQRSWLPPAAFAVGYAVIVGFLKLVETENFSPFVIYRLLLAGLLVYLLGAGVMSAY